MTTAPDSPEAYLLTTVEEVDELYSELLYMPERVVLTPSGDVWLVWTDRRDESMQLKRVSGGDGRELQIAPASFAEAFTHLADGWVVPRRNQLKAAITTRSICPHIG